MNLDRYRLGVNSLSGDHRNLSFYQRVLNLAPAAWVGAQYITGLSNDNAVATWSDISGNARHFTQGTAARQPIYKTNIRNGKPVVRFTAANTHWMSVATSTALFKYLHDGTGCTLFFVGKLNATNANYTFMDNCDGGSANVGMFFYGTATAKNYLFIARGVAGNITILNETTSSDTNYNIHCIRHATAQTNDFQYRINNDGKLDLNYTNTPSTANATRNLRIGGVETTNPLDGDIAEIIMFNKLLTDDERLTVHRYLSQQWGITLA